MIINLGDAPFKAFISVNYPSGTCTVTHESGTKLTHSGGGKHTFTVNKKGKWIVTATPASGAAKTSEVTINTRGEVKTVSLSYELVLFDGNLASGYSLNTNFISPAILQGQYSELEVEATYFGQGQLNVAFVENPGGVSPFSPPKDCIVFSTSFTSSYTTKKLTISGLSGDRHVGFWDATWDAEPHTISDGLIKYKAGNVEYSIKRIVLR